MPVFESAMISQIIDFSTSKAVNFRARDRKESHYIVISGRKHTAPKILFQSPADHEIFHIKIRESFRRSALFTMQCRTKTEQKNCRLFFLIREFSDQKMIDALLLEQDIWGMTNFEYSRQLSVSVPTTLIKICLTFNNAANENVAQRLANEIKAKIRKQKIKMTKRQIKLSLKDAMILFAIKALGNSPKGDIDV